MIYLIGLGISDGDLTGSATEILSKGYETLVRTAHSQSHQNIKNYPHRALDSIYQKSRNFDTLSKNLAAGVRAAHKQYENIIYCVDGSPEEDESCRIILKREKNVHIIPGISKSAHIKAAAGLSDTNCRCVSAYAFTAQPQEGALVIYDIDDFFAAQRVKLMLSDIYGDEAQISFVNGFNSRKIKVYELDRQGEYGNLCGVAIPQENEKKRFGYYHLKKIVERLRAPGGCPWDREQTHGSLAKNAIEEAYELADAIEKGDDEKIAEETGDLLLQAVFHNILAESRGAYTDTDVITALCVKLITRHSHIFSNDKAEKSDDALSLWEKNKRTEKGHQSAGAAMADVPTNFPAVLYAEKLQKRAAKCGFDFTDIKDAFGKVKEELDELAGAAQKGDRENIAEECGDLLFSAVNISRLFKVDGESALKGTCKKFLQRFLKMEELIFSAGKRPEQLSAKELDDYYTAAKKILGRGI